MYGEFYTFYRLCKKVILGCIRSVNAKILPDNADDIITPTAIFYISTDSPAPTAKRGFGKIRAVGYKKVKKHDENR